MKLMKPSTSKRNELKLRTQKDGRLFAIKLLKDIDAVCEGGGEVQFMAVPWEIVDGGRHYYPPQSPMIREAFDRIYSEGSDEARAGFFVIITERLGTVCIGELKVSYIEHLERKGRFREMPEKQREARHG